MGKINSIKLVAGTAGCGTGVFYLGHFAIFIVISTDRRQANLGRSMARVMERCREMFPIETILFRGAEFRRGMQVRIMTTQQNIIEGELIGMNKINMVCIRTRTQIIAHHLEKIQEMTRLS